jgi:serine kinase of HPr protein (carbohydrate metabolism regulator)
LVRTIKANKITNTLSFYLQQQYAKTTSIDQIKQRRLNEDSFSTLIDTSQSLSVKFISENINNRGKLLTYYQKLSTQFIQQQQKNISKLDEKIKFYIYLSNM